MRIAHLKNGQTVIQCEDGLLTSGMTVRVTYDKSNRTMYLSDGKDGYAVSIHETGTFKRGIPTVRSIRALPADLPPFAVKEAEFKVSKREGYDLQYTLPEIYELPWQNRGSFEDARDGMIARIKNTKNRQQKSVVCLNAPTWVRKQLRGAPWMEIVNGKVAA